MKRVRKKWVEKKMGVEEVEKGEEVVENVEEVMKGERKKKRVKLYYIVEKKIGKIGEI